MHDPSKLFAPAVRFLSLALLSYLPACSASEASPGSEQRGNDALETVGASRAELSVDLTTTIASAIDQRNTLDGEWPVTKVYDNDLSTKMFFHHEDNWIRYQLAGPSVVTRYEISRSLDDYPDRVPTAWTLEASHDGIVWVQLDSKSGETLPVGTPGSYDVTNSTAYLYYRLYVRDNHTDKNGDTELAEFRIFGDAPSGTVPAAPTNVTASVNSNAITVSWSAATNAQSYIVARIGDDGASVIEQTVSALSYTDTNLAPGTTYVYQIQALNGGRRGPVSTSRAVATTAFAARGLKDITALTATAPTDEHATNSGPESVAMVTDNNPYTKWYQGDGSTWIVQQAPAGSVVTQYSLTSANDYPERDPRSWTLEGSNDGTSWSPLDSRANQGFLTRHQTRIFTCNPNGVSYTYYRLTITSTRSTDTQLAEWRLFGTTSAALAPPATPGTITLSTFSYHQDPDDDSSLLVTGNVVSNNQIGLKFGDSAGKLNPESSYVLERATNSSFSANLVTKTIGANSTSARVIGLAPSTTYYFRIKAVNAAGSSQYSPTFSAATTASSAPPNPWHENGWYGHKSRNLILGDTDDTGKIRVYFDDQVQNPTSIKWITPMMAAVWKRVTDNYGSLSDAYLHVIANTPGSGYGGGGAVNLYDPRGGFRNAPWVASDGWQSIDWTDWDNVWKVHALTHETAHIVEAVNVNKGYAGAPSVWEDSWWAYIFQYDLYKNLPTVFPDVFSRWRDEGLAGKGDYGWYWARDWLIPIYEGQFGNTGSANKGINFLVRYFQLQAQNLPTYNDEFAPRPFTLGDYVHLCSGVAGVDLAPKARLAFLGWGALEELQLARAQLDMPAVSALYRGNLAPGFTFDPIARTGQLNAPLSGQTLAGSAADPNPSDALTYSKVSGPAWLTVASDGTLGGTPTTSGAVTATVKVSDAGGLFDTATLTINVAGGGADPCSGLCSNPVTFTALNYNSGSLGSGATCHQTTTTLNGFVCGNFNSPRTFAVNGTTFTCNNQTTAAPAKRNGGYCFQASAGSPDWAYFQTF
jgi:hypothetical protein